MTVLLRGLIDWLFPPKAPLPADARCLNCEWFIDYFEPDDYPDEVDGYCSHPAHSDPSRSPHADYGGHWTHSSQRCEWWSRSGPEGPVWGASEKRLARQAGKLPDMEGQ